MIRPNDEQWEGNAWVRRSESWGRWWRRVNGDQKEFEVEEVDEEASPRQTGRLWWGTGRGRKVGFRGSERRPLLDGDHHIAVRELGQRGELNS